MTITCRNCKNQISVTPQQVAAWRGGVLIQKAMSHLPAGERELLISGTCDNASTQCFKSKVH